MTLLGLSYHLWTCGHHTAYAHDMLMMSQQPIHCRIPLLWGKTQNAVWRRCCIADILRLHSNVSHAPVVSQASVTCTCGKSQHTVCVYSCIVCVCVHVHVDSSRKITSNSAAFKRQDILTRGSLSTANRYL